jgi:hypothetical protein
MFAASKGAKNVQVEKSFKIRDNAIVASTHDASWYERTTARGDQGD